MDGASGNKGTGRPGWKRSPEEIARKLDLRAKRAIDYITEHAHGRTPRDCPVCGYHGMFSPVRNKPEIWCPACDSRPRHRLMWLWMERELKLPPAPRVLHFAAEAWARSWFEERGADYVTADINGQFDLTLDITAMDLPGGGFDMVIANHVLEHVDDRAALAEIFRVLRPGGLALLTAPVIEGWDQTYEDPADTTREARLLHYGDATHLRFYGRDIRDRIRAAGLELSEYTAH